MILPNENITKFSAEVEGERVQVDDAKPFKKIIVKFIKKWEIALCRGKECLQL